MKRLVIALAICMACDPEAPHVPPTDTEPAVPVVKPPPKAIEPAPVPMRLLYENNCSRAPDMRIKLFDITGETAWPESDPLPSGAIIGADIACTPGHFICYGARSGGLFWGKDLDGLQVCTDCCIRCAAVIAQPIQLSCQ